MKKILIILLATVVFGNLNAQNTCSGGVPKPINHSQAASICGYVYMLYVSPTTSYVVLVDATVDANWGFSLLPSTQSHGFLSFDKQDNNILVMLTTAQLHNKKVWIRIGEAGNDTNVNKIAYLKYFNDD